MYSQCIHSTSDRISVTGNGFSDIGFLYDVDILAVRCCVLSILAIFHCACATSTILQLPV